jgi:Fe-S-cluster containining protein
VDINLASAITSIKVAVKEAADKASIRRLQVYKNEISCKPGCSACCNRQVYITIAEALIIQDELEKTGQWPQAEKRAHALLITARDTPPVSWFKMNIMCPVLDPVTKLCTAYDFRPTPCSTHFVKSDPALCDPWSMKSGQFDPIDFIDLHEELQQILRKIVDGYGILALKYSMPIALIFASRIKTQSGLGPNEVMSLIFNELR